MIDDGGGDGAFHGSHLQHPLFPTCDRTVAEAHCCSLCWSVLQWKEGVFYMCKQCKYHLCSKCFEIHEQPFGSIQVVVRNPQIPADDVTACVRTRPRSNSYALCPLYGGMLIEVVAYAKSTYEVDQDQIYFRQSWGGWVNAQHVVCVVPMDSVIDQLARTHLNFRSFDVIEKVPYDFVVRCMEESMTLLNDTPAFGAVIACYTLMPTVMALIGAKRELEEKNEDNSEDCANVDYALVYRTIEFGHFVLHFVLDELDAMLRSQAIPIAANMALPLHVMLLGRCITVLFELPQEAKSSFPAEFVLLVCRCADVLHRLNDALSTQEEWNDLQRGDLWLSIARYHVKRNIKMRDVRNQCYVTTFYTARLLVSLPVIKYPVKYMMALRSMCVLDRYDGGDVARYLFVLCTRAVAYDRHQQRMLSDIDIGELALPLLRKSMVGDTKAAACMALAAMVSGSPEMIERLAQYLIQPLVRVLMTTVTSSEVNAVVLCLFELAFCDPKAVAPAVSGSRSKWGNSERDEAGGGSSSLNPSPPRCCTTHLYGKSAVLQRMHVGRLAGSQALVPLCDWCASHHPGGTASETSHAYFQCACTTCPAMDRSSVAHQPPAIPQMTTAVSMMVASGVPALLAKRLRTTGLAVANAVGKLALRLGVYEEVVQGIMVSLLHSDLGGYEEAALTVMAQQHLSSVQEVAQRYKTTAISRYILREPAMKSMGNTPNAHHSPCREGNGLTPSPGPVLTRV